MTRSTLVVLLVCVFAIMSPAAFAQAPRPGRVIVTVVDPTGAVLPGATVTIIGLDETTKKAVVAPIKASEKGIATFEKLPPGRYSIQGEFPGFALGLLRDIRVRSGDNKHVLLLPLDKVTAEITVGRDPQTAASDRGTTFGTALTREQVEALSDDPDEMRRQLADMAGPGAAIRVDSFEGQQLPPKAQIKSIHITRDMFAAENHMAGGLFIDIITQPGIGPLRGSGRASLYDSALDGQNPLIPKKGPAHSQSFGMNIGGSLIKEKSTFSLSINGSSGYQTPNLYVATSAGRVAQNLNLRMPSNSVFVSGLWDYAVTRDQTLRVSFSRNSNKSRNQGVGAYDLMERAYSTESRNFSLRVQEAGPLGRRFFTNTRFSLIWSDTDSRSVTESPTVVVNDSFTGGGAQRKGGRHTRGFSLASDLDYVRGIHSWRTGILLDGGNYRSDDSANYLGTYTFENLTAYDAGQPRTYTRRLGDPTINYWNVQAGFYLQDDIRISKNFTVSPGVRVEAQTHLEDHVNIGPRIGVTWAPFKSGKTTLRGSAGRFYDWLSAGTFEQTLRVDGFHQQELNVLNPSYPDPGLVGAVSATNRYLLGDDLRMANNTRLSAGIDQQVTKVLRVGAVYSNVHVDGVLVGQNLNAPVGGLRPDPAFVNVIETISAGRTRTQSLSVNVNLNFSTPAFGGTTTGPRWSWKRGLMAFGSFYIGKSENNTEGAFSVPASGNLDTEWGPSSSDVRHRVNMAVYSQFFKNLTIMFNASVSSAAPYTIRTGRDENGDLLFNDRPAGVGRNTLRGAAQWNSYTMFQYVIGFGKRRIPLPPGIMITSSGGGLSVGTMAQPDAPRYRLMLALNVQNLTNHANYVVYSGLMTSPFFMQPTMASGVRRVDLSAGFSF